MLKVKSIYRAIFFLLLLYPYVVFAYKAMTIVPVADCYEFPLQDNFNVHEYDGPGVSEDTKNEKNPRCYQLLFNETVDVIEQKGDYLCVAIPHILYCGNGRGDLKNSFWIHKGSVISLKNIQKKEVLIKYIPQPIISSYQDLALCNKGVVTLTMPFYDPVTQKHYSAGTRFVQVNQANSTCNHIYTCNTHHILVWILDTKNWQWEYTSIPKNICITYCGKKTQKERIVDFVRLIRTWANQTTGFIPYVWGGASFCYTMHTKQKHPYQVYCGFDCSCLVSRAAQICGIPYFLKNTATIGCILTPLRFDQKIKSGDLLWWFGHVMVVSSVEDNLLIHARGYGSGYGILHETPLKEVFKDVVTYDDLRMSWLQRKPLRVLNKQGNVCAKIDIFNFYSLTY